MKSTFPTLLVRVLVLKSSASDMSTAEISETTNPLPAEPGEPLALESWSLLMNGILSATALIYNYVFLLGLSSLYSSQISALQNSYIPLLPISTTENTAGNAEWSAFVGPLVKMWKMQSVACALLSSAVVALLQVSSFSDNIITETLAIVIIICSVAGFLVATLYALHISRLRTEEDGRIWVKDATKIKDSAFFNAPALLAVPRVWFIWSIVLFPALILCFVWRHSSEDRSSSNDTLPLPSRLILTIVFCIAFVHISYVYYCFSRLGTVHIASADDVDSDESTIFAGFYRSATIQLPVPASPTDSEEQPTELPADQSSAVLDDGDIEATFCLGNSNHPPGIHVDINNKPTAGGLLRYSKTRKPSIFSPF